MSLLRSCLGPSLVAAAGIAMAAATWGTWPDPLVDFGKEVYIAWQLSLGQHLYQNVAYHLGPLSPYLNALAFKIFGPTLATLEWLNLSLLAVMIFLAYRLIRRIAGDLAATAASLTFIALFAFAHFTTIADYNFIAPYDHAHTHGILIGLLGLTAADIYQRTGRRLALAAAGLAVGLAFLTRAELLLAAAAGVCVIIFQKRGNKWPFAAAIALPILIAWSLLAAALPAPLAFRGLLGSWPIVFDRSVSANPFYQDSMGTLHPAASLLRLLCWTLIWAALFLPPMAFGNAKSAKRLWVVIALLWGAGGAWLAGHFMDPADAFAPLPLALLVCFFLARKRAGEAFPLAAGFIAWALVLLAKIILNARIVHYGFVLAMPATLLVVAAGFGWTSAPVRSAMAGALIITIAAYLSLANRLIGLQTYSVGTGPNQFWADQRGGMLNDALIFLQQKSSPLQTLAVMPEGAMLNVLTGMSNSTPYWSFNPPYAFFAPGRGEAAGEAKILAALQKNPPDWVVLAAEDLSDFGAPFFGRDYGLDIYTYVQQNYLPVSRIGAAPFTSQSFGIIILRRIGYNASAPPSGAGEPHAVSTGR